MTSRMPFRYRRFDDPDYTDEEVAAFETRIPRINSKAVLLVAHGCGLIRTPEGLAAVADRLDQLGWYSFRETLVQRGDLQPVPQR